MKKVLVTGGAGFIGSHMVDRLLSDGIKVVCYDKLTPKARKYGRWHRHLKHPNYTLVIGDLLEKIKLFEAMHGCDTVIHLAANGDIPEGLRDTYLDFNNNILGTQNLLDCARRNDGIDDILFSSTAAVYGDVKDCHMLNEKDGPLLPVSLYGGSKVACEGMISAFCHLFNMRGLIFRFGNVVGGTMDHGVIHDFVKKLKENPTTLQVLGDGNQRRPYFLVEDCVDGMLHAYRRASYKEACDVYTLGVNSTTSVTMVAEMVRATMKLPDAKITYTGGRAGFIGDLPFISYTMDKMKALGWEAKLTSNMAVAIAAERQFKTHIT